MPTAAIRRNYDLESSQSTEAQEGAVPRQLSAAGDSDCVERSDQVSYRCRIPTQWTRVEVNRSPAGGRVRRGIGQAAARWSSKSQTAPDHVKEADQRQGLWAIGCGSGRRDKHIRARSLALDGGGGTWEPSQDVGIRRTEPFDVEPRVGTCQRIPAANLSASGASPFGKRAT